MNRSWTSSRSAARMAAAGGRRRRARRPGRRGPRLPRGRLKMGGGGERRRRRRGRRFSACEGVSTRSNPRARAPDAAAPATARGPAIAFTVRRDLVRHGGGRKRGSKGEGRRNGERVVGRAGRGQRALSPTPTAARRRPRPPPPWATPTSRCAPQPPRGARRAVRTRERRFGRALAAAGARRRRPRRGAAVRATPRQVGGAAAGVQSVGEGRGRIARW